MQTYYLSNQNPTFTLKGEEEKMSAEILKVILKKTSPNRILQLQVTDENNLLIYSKPLIPKPVSPDAVTFSPFPEVPVNKRFIFNAYLQVNIVDSNGSTFLAEIQVV